MNGDSNKLHPRDRSAHEWYRFVLSFPPHLVRDYLRRFGVSSKHRVLDPFCGTGATLAVLGLSFKPNTNDLRDAPALDIIPKLQAAGADVRAYDPAGMDEARTLLPTVMLCADAYEAAAGADALILMTEWNQFRNLDLNRIKRSLSTPVFVDLRNVYEPARMTALGFRYTSVGRPTP